MSFRILLVTATSIEAEFLKKISGMMPFQDGYRFGNFEIMLLVSGTGSIATVWGLKQWISVNKKPDLAMNAGIAGSYKDEYTIGDVVMPLSDCFADAGVEDRDNFLTLAEAGLIGADEFPFRGSLLLSDSRYYVQLKSLLRSVRAITVNTSTGSEATRKRLLNKFNPDIETMEGAAFFYFCTRENIPFLALRAISNKVEPRDKNKWNIPLALENMSIKFKEVIETLK